MRYAAPFLLLVAIAACGGATEPASIFGTYRLQSIDGARLPASPGPSSGSRITAGTLSLGVDGQFSFALEDDHSPYGGVGDNWLRWRGTFTRTGTALVLTGKLEPPVELFEHPTETMHATASGRVVSVRYDLRGVGDGEESYVFVR